MLPSAQQAWGGEGSVLGGDGDWQGPGALNHPHCQRIGTPKYLQDTGPSSQDIPGIVWVTLWESSGLSSLERFPCI